MLVDKQLLAKVDNPLETRVRTPRSDFGLVNFCESALPQDHLQVPDQAAEHVRAVAQRPPVDRGQVEVDAGVAQTGRNTARFSPRGKPGQRA